MKKILEEIQTGEFAREWLLENKVNAPRFKRIRAINRTHQLEEVGRKLRKLMSWIDDKEM
jgi:ketol-acid reductoisomerase